MFKSKISKGSTGAVPGTPKIPKLALPDEVGADICCAASRFASRPSTPLKSSPSASMKAHTTPSTKVLPLKSILKGKTSPVRDCYESEGETLRSKRVVRGNYGTPSPLPPHVHLGPMKPPALDLHWQLLPYQPQRSKHPLHFDIAFPIDEIRFKDYPVPNRPLTSADLDKPAANDKMTKMVIQFKNFPDWEIFIKRNEGIRCRDVFEAIYSNFNIPLTPLEERTLIHPANRKLCEEAFRLRCKLAAGLTVVEKSLGFKRVDVLLHSTLFKGLTQPKSGGDWVLNLG